jgi:long-chain acyl-CoA synthetase
VEDLETLLPDLNLNDWEKPKIASKALAQIMYTSGTTGAPKGVMHSHDNLTASLQSLRQQVPLTVEDKLLSLLPLSHILEQMVGLLLPYSQQAEIIYTHSPTAIPELMREHRVTKMVGVPEFLKLVMDKIEFQAEQQGKQHWLERMMQLSLKIPSMAVRRRLFYPVLKKFGGRLNTVASGGSPLDPTLEKRWNALGVDLLQGYGLTETAALVTGNTYENHKLSSVGKPFPGIQVEIASDQEILVKGLNVFEGYFKNKQKTDEVLAKDGWFHTGDMGEFDEGGFLFLKGRKKYMILGPGGQNVYPEDIEKEFKRFKEIEDVCVVGLDKASGQVEIHAVLLLKSDKPGSPQIMIKQVNSRLASYQQVGGWTKWTEEDFPRSATKKIKKHEVTAWLQHHKRHQDKSASRSYSEVERLVAKVTHTPLREIEPKATLAKLQVDSLLRIELIAAIEDQFGKTVKETDIDTQTTVKQLEHLVKTGTPVQAKEQLSWWPRWRITRLARQVLLHGLAFRLTRLLMTELEIVGTEHLRDVSLPIILMPNHAGHMDVPILTSAMPAEIGNKLAIAAARDTMYGIHKKNVHWVELLYNIYPFPRRENENVKLGLDFTGKLLDKGWSVMIFPEGELTRDGQMLPLKTGAGLIAVEMGVPVVPVKTEGSFKIWRKGQNWPPNRGPVKVTFGKPLQFSRKDSYGQATKKIAAAIQSL